MSLIGNIIQRGLKQLETQLGHHTFLYLGTVYNCIPSNLKNGSQLVIGGNLQTVDLTLIVRRDEMEMAPNINDNIIYDEVQYAVMNVSKPAGNGTYELELRKLN